jgi:hypothetical protein
MKCRKSVAFILCATFFVVSSGFSQGFSPVTITFGQDSRDIGNQGPLQESGFQYEGFGDSWQLINTNLWGHGGDGTALFTFFGIFPAIGNSMIFQQTNGSPFVFQSVDLRGRFESQPNSIVAVKGFFNGLEVASQVLQSSNETWRVQLTNPSFLNPIDQLQLKVIEVNGAALMLDNFVFAVPEPNTCALLALGLSSFAWLRTRKRSRKLVS